MPDELDPILEARLRAALRTEADALGFTLRAAELQRSAATRHSARRSQRFALLAVAASVVVALGSVAILSAVRPDGDVAATPAGTTPADRPVTPGPAPTATPFALASYGDLERLLAGADSGQRILARAERTDPPASGAVTETQIASLDTYNSLGFVFSCTGGSLAVDVYEGEVVAFGFETACADQPHQDNNGVPSSGGPVRVVVRTTGPVVWRLVMGGYLKQDVASAPPASTLQPGETRLVRLDVRAGDPEKEQTATIPAGTDVLYLTAPCAGEGTLEIEIDGVAASYACGAIGIETFTPNFSNQLIVRAGATGTAAFAVRVGAVDWEAARPGAWRPPALRLSGPDQTARDIVTLTAFPGCGWSWQPRDGGGSSTGCGPSWQPMGAALWQREGTRVTVHLGGGWTITDIAVEIARNEDILASGRAPSSQPWPVKAVGDEPFVLDVPAPGDWGVRLWVNGERNGDRFQVPYYARIVVGGR